MTREELKTLKVGDKVRAKRDVSLYGTKYITKGNIYEVLGVGNATTIFFESDDGARYWWHFEKFDLITDDQPEPEKATQSNACDCGARVCNTTHASWCSTRKEGIAR